MIDPFFKQLGQAGAGSPRCGAAAPTCPMTNRSTRISGHFRIFQLEEGPPFLDRRRADGVVRHRVGAVGGARARSGLGNRLGGDDRGVAAARRAALSRSRRRTRASAWRASRPPTTASTIAYEIRHADFRSRRGARCRRAIRPGARQPAVFSPRHRHRRRPSAEGGLPVRAARRHPRLLRRRGGASGAGRHCSRASSRRSSASVWRPPRATRR